MYHTLYIPLKYIGYFQLNTIYKSVQCLDDLKKQVSILHNKYWIFEILKAFSFQKI